MESYATCHTVCRPTATHLSIQLEAQFIPPHSTDKSRQSTVGALRWWTFWSPAAYFNHYSGGDYHSIPSCKNEEKGRL